MSKISELFNKRNPLLWQKVYAARLKELDKISEGELMSHLESRLSCRMDELKKTNDEFSRNSILREIDFIYRAAALSSEHDKIKKSGSSYLITASAELFQKTHSSRLRTTLIEFISSQKKLNEEMSELFEVIIIESLFGVKEDLQTAYAALDYISSVNLQRLLEAADYFSARYGSLTDRFICKKIAACLIKHYGENKKLSSAVEVYLDKFWLDPIVMSGISENLHLLNKEKHMICFYKKILKSADTALMCAAFESLLRAFKITSDKRKSLFFQEIIESLSVDDERFGLFVLNRISVLAEDGLADEFKKMLILGLKALQTETLSERVRLSVAMTYEKVMIFSDGKSNRLYEEIKKILYGKERSRFIKIPEKILEGFDDDSIGRVLSVLSQNNFSIQFKRGFFKRVFLVKDAFFKFRLWRFLHEFQNASVSKRKNISHTTGRRFASNLRSASSVLADESQTTVPGEPLAGSGKGENHSSIPLPDDFISAIENNKNQYKIYSPYGVTLIRAPKGIFRKLHADLQITLSFSALSEKRNISISQYLAAFRKMGFEIQIEPYEVNRKIDEKASALKACAILPAMPLFNGSLNEEFKKYLFAMQSNTIEQLYIFVIAFVIFFIIRHIVINRHFRRVREKFPLCLGGWGTRGKSSLERLKCALFETAGCTYFSKTTGSEASFVYSLKDGVSAVVPIFRPFGKTTIWEQLNFSRLAARMGVEIFLWECMAVTPAYVKTMQKTWMRDDISTITNTYPDHEDHQGPAPWNVADSMADFVPYNGTLITAEKQMYPFLENRSVQNKSRFERVDDTDILTIPDVIFELMPYREHPANIALLLRLADFLGINRDIALHGIIKRVKSDIGALKIYPPISVNNREITFVSGFSANEKTACLYNWREAKMVKSENIGRNILTAVLINNRKDRPARSAVFSEIAVKDIDPDFYFVTGDGLSSFINSVKSLSLTCMSTEQSESFMKKFIVIESKTSSPESVFEFIASFIPEGASCKVMGIQNIKGIGVEIYDYLENRGTKIKIPVRGNILIRIINGFFSPLRMIINRRRADYIYTLLGKNKITPENASSVVSSLMK